MEYTQRGTHGVHWPLLAHSNNINNTPTLDRYVRSRPSRSAAADAAEAYRGLSGAASSCGVPPRPRRTSAASGGGTASSGGLSRTSPPGQRKPHSTAVGKHLQVAAHRAAPGVQSDQGRAPTDCVCCVCCGAGEGAHSIHSIHSMHSMHSIHSIYSIYSTLRRGRGEADSSTAGHTCAAGHRTGLPALVACGCS
jgi:hypothetical protein